MSFAGPAPADLPEIQISDISGLRSELDSKIEEVGVIQISSVAGLQTSLNGKQSTLLTGDVSIEMVNQLAENLNAKQNLIQNGDLTIAMVNQLQEALNAKANLITDNSLSISRTSGLQSQLDSKQPNIQNGDLTIAHVNGLQAVLDTIISVNQHLCVYNSTSATGTEGSTLVVPLDTILSETPTGSSLSIQSDGSVLVGNTGFLAHISWGVTVKCLSNSFHHYHVQIQRKAPGGSFQTVPGCRIEMNAKNSVGETSGTCSAIFFLSPANFYRLSVFGAVSGSTGDQYSLPVEGSRLTILQVG